MTVFSITEYLIIQLTAEKAVMVKMVIEIPRNIPQTNLQTVILSSNLFNQQGKRSSN